MKEGKPESALYKFLTDRFVLCCLSILILGGAIFGGMVLRDWYSDQNIWFTSTRMPHTQSFEKSLPEGNYRFEIFLADNVTNVRQLDFNKTFISGTISIYINDTLIRQQFDSKLPEEAFDSDGFPLGYWPAYFKVFHEYQVNSQSLLKIEISNATATYQPIYWIIIHQNHDQLLADGFFLSGAIFICSFFFGIRFLLLRYLRNNY